MSETAPIGRDPAAFPAAFDVRERIAEQRRRAPRAAADHETAAPPPSMARRLFRRGPWENAATVLIGLGVVMLMQPFALDLFTYSFVTILIGTVTFIIVSHFPE